MKIEYTLKEVRDNIFAVIVPNDYDRAMLFCKMQEYYESDNKLFKGESFSIWDYMKWYAEKNKGVFTYTKDWDGFNIPFDVAMHFMVPNEVESPYDKEMQIILEKIYHNYKSDRKKAYIIGVKSDKGDTFNHEMCHALYYTYRIYKKEINIITHNEMSLNTYNILIQNLIELGYNNNVIDDEIQAYMVTNYKSKYFSKGADKNELNKLHKIYKQKFDYTSNHYLK